jgi:NAD(P)H-hydrate epimerase
MAARVCKVPDIPAGALLTTAEMAEADRLTIGLGISAEALMEAAGARVAEAIHRRWPPGMVAVLCGPGGNGGDGFVVARLLADRGWTVRLASLLPIASLRGATAHHAHLWSLTGAGTHGVEPLSAFVLDGAVLVVDALFGAGLSRGLDVPVRDVLLAARARNIPIVSIDVPSGVSGDDGVDLGAVPADLTVTFFRKKPGHLLQPGRALCGMLEVADIGIPDGVLDVVGPAAWENTPSLWHRQFPKLTATGHKYSRGHALIWGGFPMTGAARLAARAAARVGAGLVTLAVPEQAFPIYAANCLSIMVTPIDGSAALERVLADPRLSGLLAGPGAGHSAQMRSRVLTLLRAARPMVLDADVFALFRDAGPELFAAITAPCVMTPHEGEFSRVFDATGSKLARARQAARTSGAVIVLKGSDTVIAAPDGRAAINANAPPSLATAGAGDVLAGMVTGLLAQGMPAFEAACAAVWLHGGAAAGFGPGLIAEDLPERLPAVLRDLDLYISGGHA